MSAQQETGQSAFRLLLKGQGQSLGPPEFHQPFLNHLGILGRKDRGSGTIGEAVELREVSGHFLAAGAATVEVIVDK